MIATTAFAGTTLDIYFDNEVAGHGGNSVQLDRGYLNAYISCSSTDVDTCRGTATLAIKGKTVKSTSFEGTAGEAAGVAIKVPSKYAKKSFTAKVCARETATSARDCGSIKVKK